MSNENLKKIWQINIKTIFLVIFDFADFGQSLGLPDLLALKDVLSFNMNSIKLKTVLDFLGNTTQQKLKSTINKVLKEVEV